MNKYIIIFCSVICLCGCAELRPYDPENARVLEPIVVVPSFGSNYLLSCLKETQNLGRKKFDNELEKAKAKLDNGRERDKLHFICRRGNEKAEYR